MDAHTIDPYIFEHHEVRNRTIVPVAPSQLDEVGAQVAGVFSAVAKG